MGAVPEIDSISLANKHAIARTGIGICIIKATLEEGRDAYTSEVETENGRISTSSTDLKKTVPYFPSTINFGEFREGNDCGLLKRPFHVSICPAAMNQVAPSRLESIEILEELFIEVNVNV